MEKFYIASQIKSMVNKYPVLWGTGSENHQPIPKIIWIYWQPIVPSPLVEICISQVKKIHPDFEINIINPNTLTFFLPDIPERRTDLPFANYSDVIRLALLEKYGGIWMDASILLSKRLDWVFEQNEQYHPDLIGFFADFLTNNKNFPILETWFLAVPKGNSFIKAWYEEFLSCYTSENPKKYYNVLPREWIGKMDKNLADYLICYLSAIKIMRSNADFRLLLFSSSETAHLYNFGLKLKPHQVAAEFLLKKNARCNLPIIKFEKRGRQAIDENIEKGLLSKKSLLYKLASEPAKKYTSFRYKLRYYSYLVKNILKIP